MDKMNLMNKVPNYGSLWIFFLKTGVFFFLMAQNSIIDFF